MRSSGIKLASPTDCTGCGICAAICSTRSITLEEGYMGHVFPVTNKKTCIECGLCERTCPAISPVRLSCIKEAYASWSKNENDYKTSASGGIATTLSKYIINRGGVVYGCAMLPNVEVHHIRVDKLEDLEKLKSSKYVQSSIVHIIPSLKNDIKSGKTVLFIGTPCQVAAIRALFKSQPEKLYLVDLICHGVPSLKLLQNYVRKSIPNKICSKVTFRLGPRYLLQIWDNDKSIFSMPFRSPSYRGWYLDAFLDGYTLRDSCYKCPYASSERIGDITIGDFWGLGKKTPATEIPDHPFGCSVVLSISEVGSQLINEIRPYIELYPREVQEAITGNTQLRRPFKKNKRITLYRMIQRIVFWPELYRWINIDKLISAYFKGC